jgi:hypothetical protein
MPTSMTFRWTLAIALALAPAIGCRNNDPPVPAASDPEGKDLVKGAIVAAAEKDGKYRLNKIIWVDDLPPPMGHEYHLIAYDPVVDSYQEAAALQKKGTKTVALDHILVRHVHFIKRDHRVIAHEPVSEEEFAIYQRSRR